MQHGKPAITPAFFIHSLKIQAMRTVTFEIATYHRTWDSLSMFSDLWVRQYLMTHEYFKKDGRILWTDLMFASMGFFQYYKQFASYFFPDTLEIHGLITDDIQWGIHNDLVICQVPYQKRINNVEQLISQQTDWIKKLEIEATDKQAFVRASALKKSITPAKVKRLIRWGYLEAQKLIPIRPANMYRIGWFFRQFNKISKKELLEPIYKEIEFDIIDGELLKWSWTLIKFNGDRVHHKDLFLCFV